MAKFLNEIPIEAEMMSVTAVNNSLASISSIIWARTNPGVDAVTKQSVVNSLHRDIGMIPFGNKKVWR